MCIRDRYRELQSFAQFGSDLDADTKSRLALGERIVEVLKQKSNAPVEVAHQVCILYAVTKGYLKNLEVSKIAAFQEALFATMDARFEDALTAIRTTGKLEPDTEETIQKAITEVLQLFGAQS